MIHSRLFKKNLNLIPYPTKKNDQKLLEIAGRTENGWKWLEMSGKILEMAENVWNDWKWLEMARIAGRAGNI